MIETILKVLSTFLLSGSGAGGFQATAPRYLTVETAALHVAAAEVAGKVHNVDPDLLLAIAFYESRYTPSARTAEPLGKTSCGVMTPVPKPRCVTPGLFAGYMEGAEHLRMWLNATGSTETALLGYAGGYRMIEACKQGPHVITRGGQQVDLCHRAVGMRLSRARSIARSRIRTSS